MINVNLDEVLKSTSATVRAAAILLTIGLAFTIVVSLSILAWRGHALNSPFLQIKPRIEPDAQVCMSASAAFEKAIEAGKQAGVQNATQHQLLLKYLAESPKGFDPGAYNLVRDQAKETFARQKDYDAQRNAATEGILSACKASASSSKK